MFSDEAVGKEDRQNEKAVLKQVLSENTGRFIMATVTDYLDWRGDIPFSADPFNEVDNVLLSLFAYVDLEGVLEEGGRLSLEAASEKYFTLHTREETASRDSYVRLVPFLMEKASGTRRFAETVLHHYVNIIDADADEQMSAMTFDLEDGTSYVSFRGTDGSLVGWREDFNLAWMRQTSGQKHAADYLDKVGKSGDCPLRVGGHSKGGNFAVYASAFCDASVRERILEVDTNDGPGFIQEVAESEEMKVICPKIRSLVPDESLFGLMMYGIYGHEVIKSSARRVFQHDAQTWLVEGNHFERAEKGLTEASILLDKTLTGWVANVEPKQRKKFVDFIFDVLDTSGADTLAELHQNRIRNFAELIRAAYSMDKERKNQFSEVLSVLAKNGKNVLASELKKTIDEAMKGH